MPDMQQDKPVKRRAGKKKRPKTITPDYLRNVALYYLDRYNATKQSLRLVLMRRARKAAQENDTPDETQIKDWIEALIEDLSNLAVLDDRRFALTRARSLHDAGASRRLIATRLSQKGIGTEDIEAALEALQQENVGEDLALHAARTYVRKRRLGWMRPDIKTRDAYYERDLAILARRGFSYDVARKALDDAENAH